MKKYGTAHLIVLGTIAVLLGSAGSCDGENTEPTRKPSPVCTFDGPNRDCPLKGGTAK